MNINVQIALTLVKWAVGHLLGNYYEKQETTKLFSMSLSGASFPSGRTGTE